MGAHEWLSHFDNIWIMTIMPNARMQVVLCQICTDSTFLCRALNLNREKKNDCSQNKGRKKIYEKWILASE